MGMFDRARPLPKYGDSVKGKFSRSFVKRVYGVELQPWSTATLSAL